MNSASTALPFVEAELRYLRAGTERPTRAPDARRRRGIELRTLAFFDH